MKRPHAEVVLGDFKNKRKRPSSQVLEPWALLRGKDVFRDSQELAENLEVADIRHWAPNCATFSRAREIPIPGVKSAPIPLRSEEFARGIPCEVDRMSSKAKRRLELDTNMADMAAESCIEADEKGKVFTLEHPGRSIAYTWRVGRHSFREGGWGLTIITLACLRGAGERSSRFS